MPDLAGLTSGELVSSGSGNNFAGRWQRGVRTTDYHPTAVRYLHINSQSPAQAGEREQS